MESKLILGKYKLLDEIGKGGMGRVYKAEDVRLDRIVAIKELVISDLLEENEKLEIVERFRREAQSAAGLNHPNIVTIYDVLEEDERHYIAMEYASGKTLKNKMDDNYKFTLDELLDIFIQIAAGLEHAHSKGIIHRDIKPDNIKIVDDNVVKIMDFGIASMERKKDSITQRGSLMGTLGYISPEQLYNSNKVDSRADIFSFGAMLYEFFTKKLPFEGENIAEVIMNIMTLTPIPPSKYNINIHPKIEDLILKCLDKDPEKRYQKFKEISNELMILKFSENSGELKLSDAVYDTGLLGEVNQLRLTFQENSSHTTPPNNSNTNALTFSSPLMQNIKVAFSKSFGTFGHELGQFSSPKSIYLSSDLDLYVCDTKNSRVQVFNSNEELIKVITATEMNSPCSISIDKQTNNVYVLDSEDFKIRVFDIEGKEISRFGGQGDSPWKFKGASSITISGNNKIYITDTVDSKIKVFNLQGQYLTSFGKQGEGIGEYKSPYVIASFDEYLYILDHAQPRIHVIDRAGIPQLMFGSRGAEKGKFTVPKGLAVDEAGRVYVSENLTHRVQIFDRTGRFLYSFGKKGSKEGYFNDPESISISPQNKIYVLDRGNNRVQVFRYLV